MKITTAAISTVLTGFVLCACAGGSTQEPEKATDVTLVSYPAITASQTAASEPTDNVSTAESTAFVCKLPSWEQNKTSRLKNGVWIQYSPQAMLFDAYVFTDDETVEKTRYSFENGDVTEYSDGDTYALYTYRLRGNQVLLTDENNREWTWYFTDDDDTVEFAYQDTMGGETHTISQKIRRHPSLPDYETAINERKERDRS